MGRLVAIVGIVALLVGGIGGFALGGGSWRGQARSVAAADECATFVETGKSVCGVFLTYWREHGGLAQQGFPLSDAFDERSTVDGKVYRTQYFERAVFELHPENAGTPYEVLLSLLGREQFLARYGGGAPGGPPAGGIVGQTLTFPPAFQYQVQGPGDPPLVLTGTVTAVQVGLSLSDNGRPLTPRGKFVAVTLRITNASRAPLAVGERSFVIVDSNGRQSMFAGFDANAAAARAAGRNTAPTTIAPGATEEQVFVFDVAADAGGFYLALVKMP